MKRTKIGLTAAVCAVALAVSGNSIVNADPDPNPASQSVAQIEKEISQLAQRSTQLAEDSTAAQEEEFSAHAKMLKSIDDAIAAQEESDKAQKEVAAAKADLTQVVQVIYKDSAGKIPQAYLLLSAEDMREAMHRFHAFDSVAQNFDAKVTRLKVAKKKADRLKHAAQNEAEKQGELAKKAEDAAREVKETSDAAARQLQDAQTRREQLVTELARKKQTDLAAERARAEQAEAARRARVEQWAAQRLSAARGNSAQIMADTPAPAPQRPARTNPSDAARRAAAQAAAQAEARRQAAAQAAAARQAAARQAAAQAAADRKSSLGEKIVSYAKGFSGVPYVWGGSGPDGWDCSGFVSYVFRHFGISLPHSSGAIYSAYSSRVVPASQARPGDVMWWPGHVGIYVGGNRHVAANSPALGTGVVPNWGSPVYLRIAG